jgi:ligand-binding sensor domain-containing protein
MAWRAVHFATLALPLCVFAEQLPIRSYTIANGLPADHIDCIVPDSRGFIWFCTPEGLARFDGYRMVNFGPREGLPDRGIRAFHETRSGLYLVATDRGLSMFPSSGGQGFVTYRQGADPFNRVIQALAESRAGTMWAGSGGWLLKALATGTLQPPTWSVPGKGRWITSIQEDVGDRLWVATTAGLYVIAKDGAVKQIAGDLPDLKVNALLLDSRGRLWAAIQGMLALIRNKDAGGQFGVERLYTHNEGLPGTELHSLAEAPDGAIWIGTASGISVLPANREPPLRNLTRAQGLTDTVILSLAVDKSGNMWAGTLGSGVMRISSSGFVMFGEQDGLETDQVFSVFQDRHGNVMALTNRKPPGHSLNVFDPVSLKFHTIVPQVAGERNPWGYHQLMLQARTGEWWAATRVGLCRFAPMPVEDLANRQPRCYAPDVQVHAVFEDSSGGIWAAAQSGRGDRLLRWDPRQKAITWFDDGPPRDQLVEAFAEDRSGNIWMGPSRGDLFRYDGHRFTRYTRSDGVPAGVIGSLFVDHVGRLWMGSSRGLGMLENPGATPILIRTYDTTNGLDSSNILCIAEDAMGRIYAGTGRGVDRLDPATGRVKHFSSVDGSVHGKFFSALRDNSGNLWFATRQGLWRLTPPREEPLVRPTVLITGLKIFGKSYPLSQAGEAHIRTPDLDHTRNQLQIAFVGFSEGPEANLNYTYKLEGTGVNWKDPDSEHEANYAGLAPGRYRFLVKAVNSGGQSSEPPAEVDFAITPPFWWRWWFLTIAAMAVAGMVYAFHRYRVSRLVELERVRTRIATDLHDDVGASLSRVAILTEVVKREVGSHNGDAGRMLTEIAETSRGLVDEMSDIVWSIDPRHGDLQSVVFRVREYGSAVLESQKIVWDFEAPARCENIKLSAEQRRHIFLIFKEALHNIARHACCSAVSAEIRIEDHHLTAEIRDDGHGFPAGECAAGHGLQNMRARAAEMGGWCSIVSEPGRGTSVSLKIPLKKVRGARMA